MSISHKNKTKSTGSSPSSPNPQISPSFTFDMSKADKPDNPLASTLKLDNPFTFSKPTTTPLTPMADSVSSFSFSSQTSGLERHAQFYNSDDGNMVLQVRVALF